MTKKLLSEDALLNMLEDLDAANRKLKESEEKFRAIFDSSRDGILAADIKTKQFIFSNPGISKITGYSAKELSKLTVSDIHPKADLPFIINKFEELVKGKIIIAENIPILRKNKKIAYCDINSFQNKFSGKEVLVGIFRDVTERKKTEEALKEQKEFIETLVNSNPSFIVAIAADGKIISINPAMLNVLGYTEKEVVGKDYLSKIIPKEDHEKLSKIFGTLVKEKKFTRNENQIKTKKGKKILTEWYGRPILDSKGNLQFFIGVGNDITERKKSREILEQTVAERTKDLSEANERLKELDKLKSMFIASMSHELRTPLNSIIGFTGIMMQGMSGELTKEQRKQLGIVQGSSRQLLSLINDIIDLSKVEAGKAELDIGNFNLVKIVREVEEALEVKAKERKLKMTVKMPKTMTVKSDERRVKQVITNLVDNAIKYTDKGKVQITVVKKGENAVITVTDTGIGIKKTDMHKLCKAFTQIHTKGRVRQEGTGLGLYLSKKLSTLLGGELTATSEFKKGSVFTFTLPLKYKKVKK